LIGQFGCGSDTGAWASINVELTNAGWANANPADAEAIGWG
jgi:hypothetical protein